MLLNKLKSYPKDKFLIIITISGIFAVLLIYFLVFIPIERSVDSYGILDFEFAWNSERAEEILFAWGNDGRNKQSLAISWDFLYIIGYVSVAVGLILLVSRRLQGKLQNFGIFMTLSGIISGIFDFVENINLILMLETPTSISSINVFIASFSATFKFGFLIAAIVFFLLALIILIIKKSKKK
ncbi:MAG: hypothetical protein ACFFA6_16070 [Promethearchaeota archaeon]